jgi:hypothetical protein
MIAIGADSVGAKEFRTKNTCKSNERRKGCGLLEVGIDWKAGQTTNT